MYGISFMVCKSKAKIREIFFLENLHNSKWNKFQVKQMKLRQQLFELKEG